MTGGRNQEAPPTKDVTLCCNRYNEAHRTIRHHLKGWKHLGFQTHSLNVATWQANVSAVYFGQIKLSLLQYVSYCHWQDGTNIVSLEDKAYKYSQYVHEQVVESSVYIYRILYQTIWSPRELPRLAPNKDPFCDSAQKAICRSQGTCGSGCCGCRVKRRKLADVLRKSTQTLHAPGLTKPLVLQVAFHVFMKYSSNKRW